VPEPPHEHYMAHSSSGWSRPRIVPEDDDLRRAADVLNAGERVAILIGQGATGAGDEVTQVADVLGAGVAKALLGKPALPDDLPWVTGAIGLLGTKPSWDLMMGCDTLLMVGSGFPYSEFLPEEGKARGVQVDIDPRRLGLRYPMEVNLTGDSAETLRALLPLLERKEDRSWREQVESGVADWWQTLEARAMADADPLNPQRVFWDLSPRLPEDCLLAVDSGSVTNWYARDLKLRGRMFGTVSATLASMGCAVPYAIAAKLAHPDRPVIALVGDGAMQMNGLNELITAARYRDRWSDPRLIFLVLNNQDLNQVTWEQRAMVGDPKFEASQELPDFPYARYAELLGFEGIRVDSPDQVAPAWDRALAADRPVILEAVTDPNVPPLPPHIGLDDAKALASALRGGDPDRGAVRRQSLGQPLHRLAVRPPHHGARDRRAQPVRQRRLQPLDRERDLRAAAGELVEHVCAARVALPAGAGRLLDAGAGTLGLDHLHVDPVLGARHRDAHARLRADAARGAGQLPVLQEVVGEGLVVAQDVEEVVDLLAVLGDGCGDGDGLHVPSDAVRRGGVTSSPQPDASLRTRAVDRDVARRVAVRVHEHHGRQARVGHVERPVADARVAVARDRDLVARGGRGRLGVRAAEQRGADRVHGAGRAVARSDRDDEAAHAQVEASVIHLHLAAAQDPRRSAGRDAVEGRVGGHRRSQRGLDQRTVMSAPVMAVAVMAAAAVAERSDGQRERQRAGQNH